MNLPLFGSLIDERFLNHRLRSTSLAGIAGGLVALGLFAYHFYVEHVVSWDLVAVVATIVGVKITVMAWCRLTD